ncbi:hypothetical protein NC652_014282 [Populus alba x Populus x berolinensis]|uniref:Uncharacterized protein n=1 Tax=Populus alba x Populus x berolinensis TaxID=444605 RepID=A0AAD6QWG5_9ROSI|nr:hypothetical protein NC652_014282 [Populus alba x Populus x berolinensis]KAJ6997964.1 hypothetical protein NC653_014250 [Populus alba x Populus x berolinensis]
MISLWISKNKKKIQKRTWDSKSSITLMIMIIIIIMKALKRTLP